MWDDGLLETDPILKWYRQNPDKLRPGQLKLAVDFDYTLTSSGPHDLNLLPAAHPDAARAIRRLYDVGWVIIIATSRFDSTVFSSEEMERSFLVVSEFLFENKIPFDSIWNQRAGKPNACWYLDDRSLPPFIGWEPASAFLSAYMFGVEGIFQAVHEYGYADVVRWWRFRKGEKPMYSQANEPSDLIYSYSRKQAIDDGILVDLSTFRVTGEHYKYPVACTVRVWAAIEEAVEDKTAMNDLEGILHDILWMSRNSGRTISASTRIFEVTIGRSRGPETLDLQIVCGPGDEMEPVLTIMMFDED